MHSSEGIRHHRRSSTVDGCSPLMFPSGGSLPTSSGSGSPPVSTSPGSRFPQNIGLSKRRDCPARPSRKPSGRSGMKEPCTRCTGWGRSSPRSPSLSPAAHGTRHKRSPHSTRRMVTLDLVTRGMTSTPAHPAQRILLTEMLTTELDEPGCSWIDPSAGCEAASGSRR